MPLLYDSRAAERATNRIRLIGLAALVACLFIAIAGLLRYQDIGAPADQGQGKLWVTQR